MPRDALIAYDPLAVVDSEAGPIPAVPPTWTVQYENSGWVTMWPLGRETSPGVYAHAWLAVRDTVDPRRGCWVVIGPRAFIDALKPRVARWWERLADLRADGGVIATSVKAAWRDQRARRANGTLVNVGDPLVGLYPRMVGFDDDDAETART